MKRARQLRLPFDGAAPAVKADERPARGTWPCRNCGHANGAIWWVCQTCGWQRRRRSRPSLAAPPIVDDPVPF